MDAKYVDERKEELEKDLDKFSNALNNLLKNKQTITEEDETQYKLILLDSIVNIVSLYEDEASESFDKCCVILRKNGIPGVYIDSIKCSIDESFEKKNYEKSYYEIINEIQTLQFKKLQIIDEFYKKPGWCC